MPDITHTYKIASARAAEHLDNFLYAHPNTETNPDGSPKFTNCQWFWECVLRIIRREVKRGRTAKYYADMSGYNVDDIT